MGPAAAVRLVRWFRTTRYPTWMEKTHSSDAEQPVVGLSELRYRQVSGGGREREII
jgi:hypothetical protein